MAQDNQFNFVPILSRPFRGGGLLKKITALLVLGLSILHILFKLIQIRPQLVFVLVALSVYPLVLLLLCWVSRYLFKSQMRFLAKQPYFSTCGAENIFGFADVWPDAPANKVKVVGNPISPQMALRMNEKREPQETLNLLVIGGSLGAAHFNQIMPQIDWEKWARWKIFHQCGRQHSVRPIADQYYQKGGDATVFQFSDDMLSFYQNADAVIGRAGAMTCAEVAYLGVPALLVPYPHAVDDHQTQNAQMIQKTILKLNIAPN